MPCAAASAPVIGVNSLASIAIVGYPGSSVHWNVHVPSSVRVMPELAEEVMSVTTPAGEVEFRETYGKPYGQ